MAALVSGGRAVRKLPNLPRAEYDEGELLGNEGDQPKDEMRKLQSLKPQLQVLNTSRVATIKTKAGATPRERGRAWMTKRERVLLAHEYCCVRCKAQGKMTIATEVDHRIPLEQGGTNDESNLDPLCDDCHQAKTQAEAKARGRGGSKV